MKVRFHRGGLADAMKTYFEPKNWRDFCKHCKQESKDIILKSITCTLYDNNPDERIGWDKTYILCANYKWQPKGSETLPFGFSDSNMFGLKSEKN